MLPQVKIFIILFLLFDLPISGKKWFEHANLFSSSFSAAEVGKMNQTLFFFFDLQAELTASRMA